MAFAFAATEELCAPRRAFSGLGAPAAFAFAATHELFAARRACSVLGAPAASSPADTRPRNEGRRAQTGPGNRWVHDSPVAFRRSRKKHLLNSEEYMNKVGSRCQVSNFDPCLFSVFRETGSAVGAFTAHIDDIVGCGEPDVPSKIRQFAEQRFGELKLQESSFLHVGAELAQRSDFSVAVAQDGCTKSLQPLPTSPQLWAARQKKLSMEDTKLRQCKPGGLCRAATV